MKRLLFITVFLACSMSIFAANKKPAWVTKRPVDNMSYTGIGFALKTDRDYMQEAKNQALNDLISEIKVEVQSESLLQMVGKDSNVSSYLNNTIQVRTREDIEQFELTDTWEDKNEYWIYYRLSKAEYQQIKAVRKAKASDMGYDFLTKGLAAQKNGDLTTAVNMYVKGLEAIQPCAGETLIHEHGEGMIDVGVELYASLKQVFSNIDITVEPEILEMKPMQQSATPVFISVTQNGRPLKNLKMKIEFRTGSGQLSSDNVTGTEGKIQLRVQSIVSKVPRQEILATMDIQPFAAISNPFFTDVLAALRNNIPQAIVAVDVEESERKAYIRPGRADDALKRSIGSMLTDSYFNVVADAAEADLLIILASQIKKGNVIPGEMYNFQEYYITVTIQALDANDSRVLVNYSVNDHRTLSPVSASETAARNAAVKDVMRRINKEFKKELATINLNN